MNGVDEDASMTMKDYIESEIGEKDGMISIQRSYRFMVTFDDDLIGDERIKFDNEYVYYEYYLNDFVCVTFHPNSKGVHEKVEKGDRMIMVFHLAFADNRYVPDLDHEEYGFGTPDELREVWTNLLLRIKEMLHDGCIMINDDLSMGKVPVKRARLLKMKGLAQHAH